MASMITGMLMSAAVAAAAQADRSPPSATQPALQPPALTARMAPVAESQLILPMGTEVPMKTVRELSSKRNRQGDRFDLIVSEDVFLNGYVIISRGSRGVGEITRLVPKGAFGKSGKLETRLLYVAVGNNRIRLDGSAADRGKSGTGATVATAVVAGVVSAFITGTSAHIPEGSTMIGYLDRDIPILLQQTSTTPPSPPLIRPAVPVESGSHVESGQNP